MFQILSFYFLSSLLIFELIIGDYYFSVNLIAFIMVKNLALSGDFNSYSAIYKNMCDGIIRCNTHTRELL